MSTQAGTVYIFKKSGGVWNYSQTITPPTPTSGGQFGYKTIISGDHMVISEPGATSVTSPETRAGVIHIYRLESGAWTPEQTVDANIEARQGDGLGKGLDFNGSYIAAGAPNGESGLRSGAVHAFYNDGTTWVWAGGGVYDPVDNPANMFGENISIYSSSSVVVGVPLESTTATESGGVYLCTTIGCTKTPIKPPSPETNEHFGASVWIYDDIIIAGAPGKNGGQGAIYAIGLDSVNSWSLLSSSTVPNGVQAGEGFGSAVMGTSTGSLFIGSSSRDSSSLTDIGACYVMEQTY